MKQHMLLVACLFSIVFSFPVLAANDVQLLAARLTKDSSPENVKAVTMQQKKEFCKQNAKNKRLQGAQKEDYLAACMNKNEAQLSFSNVKYQRLASVDSSMTSGR